MTEKLIMLALVLLLGTTGAGGAGKNKPGYAAEDPFLILVNKDRPLPDDYEVELQGAPYGSCNVSADIYPDLRQMLEDGQKEGLSFVVASGYRNDNYQQGLLDEDIRDFMARGMSYDDAYEEATKDTMPAGHSEHATGLAVDIVSSSYQMLNDGLESRPEIQWLQKHCAEYGFILRYPKEKEAVTKIVYESWHFRYVGREAAQEIMSRGITLEEYVEELEEAEDQTEEEISRQAAGWFLETGEELWQEFAKRAEAAVSDQKKRSALLKKYADGLARMAADYTELFGK